LYAEAVTGAITTHSAKANRNCKNRVLIFPLHGTLTLILSRKPALAKLL
jgi:hypothetical protein